MATLGKAFITSITLSLSRGSNEGFATEEWQSQRGKWREQIRMGMWRPRSKLFSIFQTEEREERKENNSTEWITLLKWGWGGESTCS